MRICPLSTHLRIPIRWDDALTRIIWIHFALTRGGLWFTKEMVVTWLTRMLLSTQPEGNMPPPSKLLHMQVLPHLCVLWFGALASVPATAQFGAVHTNS
jgi:hypothetical protein